MENYKFIAYDKKGQRIIGIKNALSLEEAKNSIKKDRLILKKIKKVNHKKISLTLPFLGKNRISKEKILQFTEEIKIILESGIGIIEALQIQEDETREKPLKEMIIDIKTNISEGSSIWEAFGKYENILGSFYINLVKIGEFSGTLSDNFHRLSKNLKMEVNIKNKIKEAAFYPGIILSFSFVVIIFLLKYVLPGFVQMFEGSTVELPMITRIFLYLGNNLGIGIFILMLVGSVGFYLHKKLLLKEKYRYSFHYFLLKIPIWGEIIRKKLVTTISKNFSLMINSGIGIIDSIENISTNIGNDYITENLFQMRNKILAGNNIGTSIRLLNIFPNNYIKMIIIGEETGKIVEIFDKISDIAKDDMEKIIKKFLVILEPLLILILGIIIGLVVIAIYLPIFNMSDIVV